MKRSFYLVWRFSWLITLPIAVAFGYWAWATVLRFNTFGVQFDPKPAQVRLHDVGKNELFHALRQGELAVQDSMSSPRTNDADIRQIALFVSETELAKLNARLPHSGFEYVEGRLFNNDKLRKVKVRYRGDHLWHWGNYKKSWRIKTKKSQLFDGMRTFNLTTRNFERQYRNHIPYLLAAQLDLLAPRSEIVQLILNGERHGVYFLVEQLGELTLRNNGLMPGDIYVGELIAKDVRAGVDRLVWNHPGLWDKAAINNHFAEDAIEPLRKLVAALNAVPSDESQRMFDALIDAEAWGRFMAFETLTQSAHSNATHNWRLYFDPARSRFVPIVWDPMGWIFGEEFDVEFDMLSSRFQQQLANNGDVLRARHRAIEHFFNSGQDQQFLKEADATLAMLDDLFKSDPHIFPPDEGLLTADLREYRTRITRAFHEIRSAYITESDPVQFAQLESDREIAVAYSGRQPLTNITLEFENPLTEAVRGQLRFWKDGRRTEVDLANMISQSLNRINVRADLLPNFHYESGTLSAGRLIRPRLVAETGYAELKLEGIEGTNHLLAVFTQRGEAKNISAQQVTRLPRKSFHEIHKIVPAPIQRIPTRWEGTIELSGMTEIDSPLIIAPGTTIHLQPGAALVLRNKVNAIGTANKPIVFRPSADQQQPWGAISLVGPNATGSEFTHCNFSEGSGLKDPLFEYSGMLSLHDAGQVVISNSTFRDNRLVDDMLHAVYTDVELRDCEFIRAYGDAVDLDLCTAVVNRCRFESSGNDGLDLMGTEVSVTNSVFHNNQDKGISVGEKSRLWAIENSFVKNAIAVQTKDDSESVLYHGDFVDNELAVDAYLKNWRYNAGGRAYVCKSRLSGNNKVATADKNSTVSIADSFCDAAIESKNVSVDRTVDMNDENLAATSERCPQLLHVEIGDGDPFWNGIDPRRRGILTDDAQSTEQ